MRNCGVAEGDCSDTADQLRYGRSRRIADLTEGSDATGNRTHSRSFQWIRGLSVGYRTSSVRD